MRHHRPDYINPDARYAPIRPAAYVPADPWAEVDPVEPISRWSASWRSLVYLAGVLTALGLLLSMFAYGVIQLAHLNTPTPAGPVWTVPTTYGPPTQTATPPVAPRSAQVIRR